MHAIQPLGRAIRIFDSAMTRARAQQTRATQRPDVFILRFRAMIPTHAHWIAAARRRAACSQTLAHRARHPTFA